MINGEFEMQSMIDMNEFINYGTCYDVGVIYKDFKWANKIYDILYNKLNAAIYTHRRNRYYMDMTLCGGIRYRFLKADNSLVGYYFNRVFIQGSVPQDYIDDYIKPTLYHQSDIVVIDD